MAAHIRLVTGPRPKRVAGLWRLREIPASRTLCGADVTDRDIPMRDARRMTGIQAAEWNVCPACVREAQRMEAARP